MSTVFTPVVTTYEHLILYAREGDVDLLKACDFSTFSKEDLNTAMEAVERYVIDCGNGRNGYALTNAKHKCVQECLEILTNALYTDYTWDTPKYEIYTKCYCLGNGNVHKIRSKETGETKAVYCSEIAKMLKGVDIHIAHFSETA
jgi:hypothetical protein